MAEVTNELLDDVLKKMQDRLGGIEHGVHEVRSEIVALRSHMIATQQDVANIYGRVANMEVRLDRIERRLDLVVDAPHNGF